MLLFQLWIAPLIYVHFTGLDDYNLAGQWSAPAPTLQQSTVSKAVIYYDVLKIVHVIRSLNSVLLTHDYTAINSIYSDLRSGFFVLQPDLKGLLF